MRDTFSYDLEDRILAELDRTKAAIETMDFPEFDMSHYYAHPKDMSGMAETKKSPV